MNSPMWNFVERVIWDSVQINAAEVTKNQVQHHTSAEIDYNLGRHLRGEIDNKVWFIIFREGHK